MFQVKEDITPSPASLASGTAVEATGSIWLEAWGDGLTAADLDRAPTVLGGGAPACSHCRIVPSRTLWPNVSSIESAIETTELLEAQE